MLCQWMQRRNSCARGCRYHDSADGRPACRTKPCHPAGEDPDLLVLLLHRYRISDLHPIHFRSDSKSAAVKLWDIQKTRLSIGDELCHYLPLLHALTGCDTTSTMFGIGKPAVIKLFQKTPSFRKTCEDFLASSIHESIRRNGESLIATIYEGSDCTNLNELRYKRFTAKVITSCSAVQVQSLRMQHHFTAWGCFTKPKSGWASQASTLLIMAGMLWIKFFFLSKWHCRQHLKNYFK